MTRYTVVKLVVESPFSIKGEERGSFQEILKVPIYTERGFEALPIIPSTSLKGAFRGIAEILGRSMRGDGRRELMRSHRREENKVKHGISNEKIDELLRELEDEDRALLERLKEGRSEEEKKDVIEGFLCPICRLFGFMGIAGKVRFSDAIPIGRPPLQHIARTSIDRKTMKVKEERLFTEELVLGSEFRFVIVVDDLDYLEEELFNAVMRYVEEEGIQLGAGKSVGRGIMRACIEQWGTR